MNVVLPSKSSERFSDGGTSAWCHNHGYILENSNMKLGVSSINYSNTQVPVACSHQQTRGMKWSMYGSVRVP